LPPSLRPPQQPAVGQLPPAWSRLQTSLAAIQLGRGEQAELELRALIRRYPRFAEARVALAAQLCLRGSIVEARSCWRAAIRLDPRCRQRHWLEESGPWPPLALVALETLMVAEIPAPSWCAASCGTLQQP